MAQARRLWLGFLVAAVAVLGAVVGLSVLALQLERSTERARLRQAHLNRLRIALWRMDSFVAPVTGRLAAHAYSHYVPALVPSLMILVATAASSTLVLASVVASLRLALSGIENLTMTLSGRLSKE